MTVTTGNIIEHVDTIKNLHGHGTNVLRWHPDGRQMAVTGGTGNLIFIWDTWERRVVKTLDKSDWAAAGELTYSRDGKYLVGRDYALGGTDARGLRRGRLTLWSVYEGYRLLDGSREGPAFDFLLAAPDGKVFSFRPGSHRTRLAKLVFLDIPSLKPLEHHIDLDGPDAVAFSHDGRVMAEGYMRPPAEGWDGAGSGCHLRLWRYPEMRLLWESRGVHNGPLASLAFSPDDRHLVSGPQASDERVFRLADGQERLNPAYLEPLKQWRVDDGRFVREITPLSQTAKWLHFLDPRHLLGVTSPRREIIVWEFLSGKALDHISLPRDRYPWTAELSPDRRTLAVGRRDEILLFSLDLPQE